MNEKELVTYEGGSLEVGRDPVLVLAEAQKAAAALKDVIERKTKKVMFNGEQYLEFEDWQLVGKFYGVTPKILETKYVEYGEVKGFEARAVAVVYDKRTGETTERSAADAMCLNDEENWGSRPKYEWHYVKKSGGSSLEDPGKEEIIWEATDKGNRPKKVKVKVGEVPVPLFQLRSMAQTRACAKALRNVLAWVVVLAGYRPTPAEELDYDRERTKDQGEQAGAAKEIPPCPKCGKVGRESSADMGGGFYCWKKKGGCGHTWGQPGKEPESKPEDKQGGTGGPKAGAYAITPAHRKLYDSIYEYCAGDMLGMGDLLETLTQWTDGSGKNHPGKREVGQISVAQAEYAMQHFNEQFGEREPGSQG